VVRVEVLTLGSLVVRVDGAPIAFNPKPSATLLHLAAVAPGEWLSTGEMRQKCKVDSPTDRSDSAMVHRIGNLRDGGVKIDTGPRGSKAYRLNTESCQVDAWDFIAGVEAGAPLDDLTRLWRHGPDEHLRRVLPGTALDAALEKLTVRIAGLDDTAAAAHQDLSRFVALFPDERRLDRVRRQGNRRRRHLLVVEDHPQQRKTICNRLEPRYRCTPIGSMEEWDEFKRDLSRFDGVDGALVDLHLTEGLDDQQGMQIVEFLRDFTEVAVALVTAKAVERSDYLRQETREEFRLVDIVDKQQDDWWRPLGIAAGLLVGTEYPQRQHRLRTWLRTAWRERRRRAERAEPGSIAERERKQDHQQYVEANNAIELKPIDEAERIVKELCRRWARRR
jgi:hypothetical protein